jgi:hypothetical protein
VIVMVLEGKTMDTLVNIIYSFKCPYFDPQVLNGYDWNEWHYGLFQKNKIRQCCLLRYELIRR